MLTQVPTLAVGMEGDQRVPSSYRGARRIPHLLAPSFPKLAAVKETKALRFLSDALATGTRQNLNPCPEPLDCVPVPDSKI